MLRELKKIKKAPQDAQQSLDSRVAHERQTSEPGALNRPLDTSRTKTQVSRGPFRNSPFRPPHEDAKRQSQESQTDLWTPLIGDACEVAKNRFRAARTPSDPGPARIGKNRRRPSRSRSTIRDLHSRANHHKDRARQAGLEDTKSIPQHALPEPCFRFKAIHTDCDRAKLSYRLTRTRDPRPSAQLRKSSSRESRASPHQRGR